MRLKHLPHPQRVLRLQGLKLAVVTGTACLLAACSALTTSGDIVSLGGGTYAINSQSLSLFQGKNQAAADGAVKAEAFCNRQGKHMEVTGSEASPNVTGVTVSKTLLMFVCTP